MSWPRKLALGAIQAACIGGIAWILLQQSDDLLVAFNLDIADTVMLVALCAVAIPIRGAEFRTANCALGVRQPLVEFSVLTLGATLLNLLPMQTRTILHGRVMKAHS